jgi:diadenosine tetraphosphate (Ap4A) HIT family hydrolase
MDFELHPQLRRDTTVLGNFPLSLTLLHRDKAVPWIILVPKHAGIREFHHLPMKEQQQFLIESQWVCQVLEAQFKPDKLNIGALGNMVPQLHYHHIARYTHDEAWPGPIWGNTAGVYRQETEQDAMTQQLMTALSESPIFT